MEVYFDNLTSENARLDRLAEEMESLVQKAEDLVQTSAAKLPEAERQRLSAILAQLETTANRIKQQALRGFRATDRAIRDNPYRSAGVALALGLVIGALIGRSGGRED